MTNDFNRSVTEQLLDSYDSIPRLQENVEQLKMVEGIAPASEKNYIQAIINTVFELTNTNAVKHAKTNDYTNFNR